MSAAPALAVSFLVPTASCISASVALHLIIFLFDTGPTFFMMLESPISAAMLSMVSSSDELGCHVQGSSKKVVGVRFFGTFLGVVKEELLDELIRGLGGDRVVGGMLHEHVGYAGERCDGVVGASPREGPVG
jgi:hypothetical protein